MSRAVAEAVAQRGCEGRATYEIALVSGTAKKMKKRRRNGFERSPQSGIHTAIRDRRAGLNTSLTHDREHRETTVLELLKLKLGECDRVVRVGVPRLSEVAELSRRLHRTRKGSGVR